MPRRTTHVREGSALDARTTRHRGYALSQWMRKRIEEVFGWMKTIDGLRQTITRILTERQWPHRFY
jgi:hypothetical protein